MKTGTSSRFRDAWAVAYSKRWIVGAWVGDPPFRPMNRLTGYRSAAALVQKVLLALHPAEADGLEDVPFPPPRGPRLVRICPLTGLRTGPQPGRPQRIESPAADRFFMLAGARSQ